MGLLEELCGCLKLMVKENREELNQLSGEKKRRKLDSESTENKEDTVEGVKTTLK